MKLKVGDIIQVEGFIMLKGMNDGDKFRVHSVVKRGFHQYYMFTKPRGRKVLFGHRVGDIDITINNQHSRNRIVVITNQ